MKKITTLLILVLTLTIFMTLPVQAEKADLIVDEVGLLTEDENVELNQLAQDITGKYKCEVSIVIVDDKGESDIKEFAKSTYEKSDYGYGEDKSGIMLLLSMKDRDYALRSYGYGNTAFTDYGKKILIDEYLLPSLSEDEYYDSFYTYLNETSEILDMSENGAPLDIDTDQDAGMPFWIKLAIVILVPLLIAGIVCFIFFQQMKTAVPERTADNYMSNDGVNLTTKADKYLYRTETRTKKDDESSGGTTTDSDGSSCETGKF